MKIKFINTTILLCVLSISPSWGKLQCPESKTCPSGKLCTETPISGKANCYDWTTRYYNTTEVNDCTRCNSGYVLQETMYNIFECGLKVTYNTCACAGCTDCTSDTTWSAGNTGYEKKVTRTCNCSTCNASTEYRCAAGYYGSSTDGTSGCTRCTSSDGIYGTSNAGSTAITSCYIPAGTTGSDSTGSFIYDGDSYYCDN